jgi:hypothetical protein
MSMAHITVQLYSRGSLNEDPIETLQPRGANVGDVVPDLNDERYPLLRYVDPYDDTFFSSNQMIGLLPELRRLAQETGNPVLPQVIVLAEQCRAKGGYLAFLGD